MFQLDERVGEKITKKPLPPKVNPLEKMLKYANDDAEDSDYDRIRMRNIQQRLELYKKVRS